MIADMSSDIFSRPIDVSKYICIYGGAQKNLAPAGVTFVIVKNDAVGKVSRYIPTMLNYQTHIDGGSMFNTPPVLPIYAALQTLRWIKLNGGVAEMQKRAYSVVRAIVRRRRNPIVSIHDHGSAGHVTVCLTGGRLRWSDSHGQASYRRRNIVCKRNYCQRISRTYGIAD